MKKLFLFCIFMVHITFMNAQTDFICGTPDDPTPDPAGRYSYRTDPAKLASYDNVVHNIFIWGINRDDGTSDDPVTEADALETVATLNIEYNKFNMFFKYTGLGFINETDIYEPQSSSGIGNYVNQHPEFDNAQAIDIYIPHQFGSGALGYAGGTRAYIAKIWLIPYTINHEIGHVFSLRHTFSGVGGSNCEHVTRDPFDLDDPNDPNDTFFNADVAGDRVVDTAACDTMRGDAVNEDCEYIQEGQDCQGTDFIIGQEPKNYMGYNEIPCVDHLTIGQGIRMREAIDTGNYGFASNDVASLFEPYRGSYRLSGPTLPEHTPLFQPGFDYSFISCDCDCPQPIAYEDTNFTYDERIGNFVSATESDYGSIIHTNHRAIQIAQLEDSQPRRCYDNNNRTPNGGTVIKFNDNVLNTNVTITAQDSLNINNNNLINNLQPGLYNIIEQYEDGSNEQQIILKSGN